MTAGEEVGSPSDAESGPLSGALPELVRTRVIALAAESLPGVAAEHLPASLKRVAAFAPARRARLAGSQIASVLETDDEFRGHLAAQVRTQVPELAQALEEGHPPAAADPVELAAVAYLMRTPGWRSVVEDASEVARAERDSASARQAAEQMNRVRRQVDHLTEELREARQLSREQVAALKAENADLRRKLGEARQRARATETAATDAGRAAEETVRASTAAASAAEAEVRRLRARVEELEREEAATRRTQRSERGSEAMKARLLLDTLLDAAQGLRRELALPAVEGSPADLVEADVAEQGSRTSTGQGSLASEDPTFLDQLLGLPRAHLIVDGYNVTKSAWPELSLERQRDRLLGALAPLVARSGAEVTVVFDAADVTDRPVVNRPRGVRVLYSQPGVIADDVIRDLVAAEPRGRPVVVASSDQEVARDVAKAGVRVVAAAALTRLLARS